MGWAHRDAPYRDSAALDLLEALRPTVDAHLMHLLDSRTFSRREFAQLPSGQVRLMPDLARALASSTMPVWERMAASQAAAVAKTLARSAGGSIRIPGSATRGARGKGRGTMARRMTKTPAPPGYDDLATYHEPTDLDDFLEEAGKLDGLVRLVEVLGRQLHASSSMAFQERVNSRSRAPGALPQAQVYAYGTLSADRTGGGPSSLRVRRRSTT